MEVDELLLSSLFWRGRQTHRRRRVRTAGERVVAARHCRVLVLFGRSAYLGGLLLAVLFVQICVGARVLQRYVLALAGRVAADHEFVARVVRVGLEADPVLVVLGHIDVIEVLLLRLVNVAGVGLLQGAGLPVGGVTMRLLRWQHGLRVGLAARL